VATAETMQRYLNTPGGAVYGFAPVDSLLQTIKRGPKTPIRGLWLASAYTLSGGYTGAMIGGAQAASSAMRQRARSSEWRPTDAFDVMGAALSIERHEPPVLPAP
jgi:all-trans-retinol 13,14-reductase